LPLVRERAEPTRASPSDDNSAQYLHARKLYNHEDIRWNYRYRDITSVSKEGRLVIDYAAFHEITPE
jgi:inward rectifier potassium channel